MDVTKNGKTKTVPNGQCCSGTPNGCGTASGVCEYTFELNACTNIPTTPPRCTGTGIGTCDQAGLSNCEQSLCTDGHCADPSPKLAGTVCAAAPGECAEPFKCDGDSPACPTADDDIVYKTTECGTPATLPCDVAEVCTGSDVNCPDNAVKLAGTVCAAAPGECAEPFKCDGDSPACPTADDDIVYKTTECGTPATLPCDVAEVCTGSDVNCPDNAVKLAGTVCAAAPGECAEPFTCDGDSPACPTADDDIVYKTTECGTPATLPCDVAEVCTGSDVNCPDNAVKLAGTVCAAAPGECAEPFKCDGDSPACPTADDDIVYKTTECGTPATLPCDVAEVCTGSDVNCPDNAVKLAGTVCAAAPGECAEPFTCDGDSPACPTADDDIVYKTTECGTPATLPCDVAEVCTGSDVNCPDNAVKLAGTVCAAAPGECAEPFTCDGDSPACPTADDDIVYKTTECGTPATLPCDVAEVCTGSDVDCPADAKKPFGAPCNSNVITPAACDADDKW
ncbi:hypothetical protein D9Q98_002790 [Chlorella vulgaris]|uniref:Uncharacterized protein n=1 Tax=Chlorella vulgaris TaxID=3077 RepID=A0A9D4TUF4_CHLVU|nr:hypothetical protein D9Q98_002790 [Chlorella vulgaris]